MFYLFLLAALSIISTTQAHAQETSESEFKKALNAEASMGNYYNSIKALGLTSPEEVHNEIKQQGTTQLNKLRDHSRDWAGGKDALLNRNFAYQRALLQATDLAGRAKGGSQEDKGHGPAAKQALQHLTPSPQDPSLDTFSSRHSGKLGMAGYQMGDSILQKYEAGKIKGLKGTTPTDVMDSFNEVGIPLDQHVTLGSVAKAVRPLTKLSFSALPWVYEMRNHKGAQKMFNLHPSTDLKQEHAAGKAAGIANLAALIGDQLHSALSRGEKSLSKKEAFLLSYLNRRHGVASDIQSAIKTIKKFSTARTYLQILGQMGLPILLALTPGSMLKMNDDQVLSLAKLAGNVAGGADSLLSIAQRMARNRVIRKIKAAAPIIEEELMHNPPTAAEREADKEARLGDLAGLEGMEMMGGA